MGRNVQRVPVRLNPYTERALSGDEIRVILRAADDLIMSGGRSLLAKLLKGSKQKVILEQGLDHSPVYGALHDLSIEEITKRIDWTIDNGYLTIEYDYRLPLLKYTAAGWAIERVTFADELLDRLDQEIKQNSQIGDIRWLSERHPQVLELIAERIARSRDPIYLPFLQCWKNQATRRMRQQILNAIRTVQQSAPCTS